MTKFKKLPVGDDDSAEIDPGVKKIMEDGYSLEEATEIFIEKNAGKITNADKVVPAPLSQKRGEPDPPSDPIVKDLPKKIFEFDFEIYSEPGKAPVVESVRAEASTEEDAIELAATKLRAFNPGAGKIVYTQKFRIIKES